MSDEYLNPPDGDGIPGVDAGPDAFWAQEGSVSGDADGGEPDGFDAPADADPLDASDGFTGDEEVDDPAALEAAERAVREDRDWTAEEEPAEEPPPLDRPIEPGESPPRPDAGLPSGMPTGPASPSSGPPCAIVLAGLAIVIAIGAAAAYLLTR